MHNVSIELLQKREREREEKTSEKHQNFQIKISASSLNTLTIQIVCGKYIREMHKCETDIRGIHRMNLCNLLVFVANIKWMCGRFGKIQFNSPRPVLANIYIIIQMEFVCVLNVQCVPVP